ncbi:permease [Sinisalibacter lacisalsi]|uniref:Permease n=2 Tax=Sinisalibacter lacisalsi TaxID=1526570 RepID=A0ABQ1QL06_9RHOB|nr:permease [Sinisalibacter lacisalsi]
MMSETARGMSAMIAATVIWGLSGLYYKLLAHVPPLEVLAHRTLWSLLFFGGLILAQRRAGDILRLLRRPRDLALVAFAAVMISTNWFLFIYSIQVGHAVEASLGYYMFPLVAVLMGVVIYREALSRLKWLAVALAAVAVVVLTWGLGVGPWISLGLAFTFGLYGVVKKGLAAGPIASVTAEVLLLAPLAAVWLFGVHKLGWEGLVGRNLGVFGSDLSTSLLLAFSGVLTGTPLVLFAKASRSLPLGSVGVLQYINPSLQFAVAAIAFGEVVTRWHWIALPLIWTALALYSAETFRQDRVSRRLARSVATSATTET